MSLVTPIIHRNIKIYLILFLIERQKENMNMGNMILVSSRADKRKCAENIGVWRDRDIEVVVGVVLPCADRDAGLGALHPLLPLLHRSCT